MDFLRGQGYDGGSNMSGKNNGVQALILQEQPLAFYAHCFSHSFNLCLSKACEVASIKNMTCIVGAVSSFFSCSAKRTDKLKYFMDTGLSNESSTTNKKTKLKKLCETRRVDRHDCLISFKELYIYTVATLEDLEFYDSNPETSSKASLYVSAITKSDFLVSLEVAVTCFSYTLQLSQVLQSKQHDFSKALANVTALRQALETKRKNADHSFKDIMNSVTKLALKVSAEITMPRTCGRRTKRVNVNAKDPEDYYKISIFIPFLDNLINQLHVRFDKRLQQIMPLEGLIPTNFRQYDDASILVAASVYENDFPVSMMSCLKAEIFIWNKQWESETNLPESAVEALQRCTELLPNVKKFYNYLLH
ncbi:zinc finger MYM-type protein 1-like [Metopolophium dirhodum]|uniref:zinc finger MYM-type protein 1-like n=1 Tax=Metopolophium dirhodum TaxID=44670 RepID=UPI002990213E|nr:zinc finger MYM-type protein 1-like [Metopolophium dirhodum]